MAYVRKTKDIWIIQQHFGPQYGWEDVDQYEDRKEAQQALITYRKNQPEYPARWQKRREKIQQA